MSLFSHRSSSTTNASASEGAACRSQREPSLELASSVSGRRLAERFVGCGAAALSAVLLLAACASSTPAKTSTPSPKDDKVFHSTAEAKKAAVDASQRFWDAYVEAQNNPDNAEMIMATVTSPQMQENELPEIKAAASRGEKIIGKARAVSFSPSNVNLRESAFTLEGIVCVEFTNLRLQDSSGRDITNPDRQGLQAIEVGYGLGSSNAKMLVLQEFGDYADPETRCS